MFTAPTPPRGQGGGLPASLARQRASLTRSFLQHTFTPGLLGAGHSVGDEW